MKINFFIFLFLSAFSNALPQFGPILRIDSLEKIAATLYDTARIDCLNQVSLQYVLAGKKDSAQYYAILAYKEAKSLNYVHGIAVSLSRQAYITRHFDDDFIKEEKLSKESLEWYGKTGNKTDIEFAYDHLNMSYLAQSRFDEVISYYEKIYANAQQNHDTLKMISCLSWLSSAYRESGNYERSFLLCQERYELALAAKEKIPFVSTLYKIAQLYQIIEDYSNALVYFRKGRQMDDNETRTHWVRSSNDIWFKMQFAEVLSHLNQFDSAWYYYQLFKPTQDKAAYMRVYWVSTGECYFLQKDYAHALENFKLGLVGHKKRNDRNQIMRTLLDIGKTYLALNNNAQALQYGREGLSMALQSKAKQFIRDGYQILSTVYDNLHKTDSAYFYYKKYMNMKDSVLNDQLKGKFAGYHYEQKIAALNEEKLIKQQQLQIQQQQLKQKSLVTKMLLGGIAVILLFGVIILRNITLKRRNEAHQRKIAEHELHLQMNELQLQKLESDKKQQEFQHKAIELEMQALRAQMNPHFIFNCLHSINGFIVTNESESASDYLTKFSRLIRMVLNNSKKESITLDDELEMLRFYLEMERLRLKYSFDYSISFQNEIDTENIFIPPLLLQPFAENAIWHGLLNKEGQGLLTVLLREENNTLSCIIEDNGVGRTKAAELNSKSAERKKSMGLQITKERLALLNKDSSERASFEVEDLYDDKGFATGTRVILRVKLEGKLEEYSLIS
jgi:Histidine kinase